LNNTNSLLKARIYFVHDWLIRAGTVINSDQFVYVFSEDSPPIGWHLWHMARFADRLQSKLAFVTDGALGTEIWYQESISTRWHVLADNLGVFESGMGQAHKKAQNTIIQAGQTAVVNYARAAFEVCSANIKKLTEIDFDKTYYGILDYGYDAKTGEVWADKSKESTVAQDLIFHATHGSRHMGMMEALRGLLGTAGTLSV
jgi:hypothetical protein